MDTKNIRTQEVIQLIELNKKKAELDFRYAILSKKSQNENAHDLEEELRSIQNKITAIQEKCAKEKISMVMPSEEQIERLNEKLKRVADTDILDALQTKNGGIYQLLTERGKVIKNNFEKRTDIAKMLLLLSGFPEEIRPTLYEVLKKGKIDSNIPYTENESKKKLLMKLFWRIGIEAYVNDQGFTNQKTEEKREQEVLVQLQNNKHVWVTKPKQTVLCEVEEKLKAISTKIQLKNAERQIKVFDEDEEREFSQIQNEYLRLLKNRDEVLDEFYSEERIVDKSFAT